MPKKKSASQIARMKKRAEARGEEYVAPVVSDDATESNNNSNGGGITKADRKKLAVVTNLKKELERIDKDAEMRSKERRSAKRKAEAIATEEAGMETVEELMKWFEENGEKLAEVQQEKSSDKTKKSKSNNGDDDVEPNEEKKEQGERKRNPYIVFIGQLSYETTSKELYDYIHEELSEEFTISPETVKIRLLTDAKTKKSRGMAFVETNDPELLYAFLKLHHTTIGGRRINVERSAGGNKQSENRKQKLQQYRKEQEEYLSDLVNKMIESHKKTGELQENELDEGVVSLCKRHSPHLVEVALTKYLESNGRDMDNPSAYFTFLIGKLATEGIIEDTKDKWGDKSKHERSSSDNKTFQKRKRDNMGSTESEHGLMGSKMLKRSSEFAKAGMDMSNSYRRDGEGDFSRIFPSMQRGRGRGRGR